MWDGAVAARLRADALRQAQASREAEVEEHRVSELIILAKVPLTLPDPDRTCLDAQLSRSLVV